jgi:signal peptidase I
MAKIGSARKSLKTGPVGQKKSIKSQLFAMSAFLRRWLSRAAKSAKSKISVASIQGVRSRRSVDSMDNHSTEIDAANAKFSLIVEALRTHGSCSFRVSGTSMLPTLWPGELVLIERKPLAEIASGDIVLYQRDGRFFLHRLENIRTHSTRVLIMIRGDAMPQQDPPVPADQLLGVLAGVRRKSNWISIPRRIPVASRGMAVVARRSVLFSHLLLRAYASLSTFVSKREQLAEIS